MVPNSGDLFMVFSSPAAKAVGVFISFGFFGIILLKGGVMKHLRWLLIGLLLVNVALGNETKDEEKEEKSKLVFRPWVGPSCLLASASLPLFGLYPIPSRFNIPVLSCGLNCFLIPLFLFPGIYHTATLGLLANDDSEGYGMAIGYYKTLYNMLKFDID